MRPLANVPMLIVTLLAACTDLPEESTDEAPIVTTNRITLNRITLNRITLNRITLNRITLNRLSVNRLTNRRLKLNMSTAAGLLATEDGREVFSLVVSCAMPADITLVATVAGTTFEFPGELGLAREWTDAPLGSSGQGWVSACMLSRVNAHDVALPISIRGPHFALTVDRDEREAFPVEEGAFYGNVFMPLDQPMLLFACRGEGQASGEFGGLVDRDCTEPDPANPGFTQCGLTFAGDCGDFAAKHSCEDFSERGTFYRRCHNQPLKRFPGRGDRVFSEVITSFVTP
jgi:hypothetical protein